MYYVYRYMIGKQWMYVGKTIGNLSQRLSSHASDKRFQQYSGMCIQFCVMNCKSDMDLTESLLIKCMHPIINRNDATDGSIPFEYDESAVVWHDYTGPQSLRNIKCSVDEHEKDDIMLSEQHIFIVLDALRSNQEYCVYSGPTFGTYYVPTQYLFDVLNVKAGTNPQHFANVLNKLFCAYQDNTNMEIRCRADNKTFCFHTFNMI